VRVVVDDDDDHDDHVFKRTCTSSSSGLISLFGQKHIILFASPISSVEPKRLIYNRSRSSFSAKQATSSFRSNKSDERKSFAYFTDFLVINSGL